MGPSGERTMMVSSHRGIVIGPETIGCAAPCSAGTVAR